MRWGPFLRRMAELPSRAGMPKTTDRCQEQEWGIYLVVAREWHRTREE